MSEFDEHVLDIDGRVVRCYVPPPMEGTAASRAYWVIRIGDCDVGTDIRADRSVSRDRTRDELKRWYRRKTAVFEHCWGSAIGVGPTRMTAEQREALRVRVAAARAALQVSARRCMELLATAAARVARFEEASASLEQTRTELQATVSQYGRLLRALDTPPERAVIQLKNAITEVVPSRERSAMAMREDAIRWGILAYYGESDAA